MDTMQQLVSKLPLIQVEKWCEFLEGQEEEAKAKPFKTFQRWLEKVGGSWEIVVACHLAWVELKGCAYILIIHRV